MPNVPGARAERLDDEETLAILHGGDLALHGLLRWSSNYTFLGEVTRGAASRPVVYKPERGERPLWDFPRGTLARRETAAFLVSRDLGWDLVPPTVLREGPHGLGSIQLFVEVDQDAHYFTFREDAGYRLSFQALVAFDIITNNADRKGGHCLQREGGRILAIDQGLCFHAEPKLRTVIWDFAGDPIPEDLLADLRRLKGELGDVDGALTRDLSSLLSSHEVRALRVRTGALASAGRYPDPPEDRRPYPWPIV